MRILRTDSHFRPTAKSGRATASKLLGGAAGITIRQAVVWGLRRSAFSNEAGLGSAPIAHAAAHCDGPVEQGI